MKAPLAVERGEGVRRYRARTAPNKRQQHAAAKRWRTTFASAALPCHRERHNNDSPVCRIAQATMPRCVVLRGRTCMTWGGAK